MGMEEQLFKRIPIVLLRDVLIQQRLHPAPAHSNPQLAQISTQPSRHFSCELCNTSYRSKKQLSAHVVTQHNTKCHLCDKYYGKDQGYRLYKHWKKHLRNSKTYEEKNMVIELALDQSVRVQSGADTGKDHSSFPEVSKTVLPKETSCNRASPVKEIGKVGDTISARTAKPTSSVREVAHRDDDISSSGTAASGKLSESHTSAPSQCTLSLPLSWHSSDSECDDNDSDIPIQPLPINISHAATNQSVDPSAEQRAKSENALPPKKLKLAGKDRVPTPTEQQPTFKCEQCNITFDDIENKMSHFSKEHTLNNRHPVSNTTMTVNRNVCITKPIPAKRGLSPVNAVTDVCKPPVKSAPSELSHDIKGYEKSAPNTKAATYHSKAQPPVLPTHVKRSPPNYGSPHHKVLQHGPAGANFSLHSPDADLPFFVKSANPATVICRLCRCVLESVVSLKTHVFTYHKEFLMEKLRERALRKSQNAGILHLSNSVNKEFPNPFNLELSCANCAFKTTDPAQLSAHIAGSHQLKLKQCQYCDYQSLFDEEMAKHNEAYHILRQCHLCEVTTLSQTGLQNHIKNCHSQHVNM